MSAAEGSRQAASRATKARAATTEAMLEAAEELFAARGFSAVTVRDIAKQAGVSHALVHRYLGKKEGIYRMVLQRNDDVILVAAAGSDDLLEAVTRMFQAGLAHRRYLRLVTHSALHGLPFAATMGRFPATELLVALAQKQTGADPPSGAIDPRVAVVVALYLGWIALEPWLVPTAGLQDVDEALLLADLERTIRCLIAGTIPGLSAT
jgi:AcrR family transcriptional regulator